MKLVGKKSRINLQSSLMARRYFEVALNGIRDQVHQMCMVTKLGDTVNNEFSSSRPVSPMLDKINDHVKQFILGPKCLDVGDHFQKPSTTVM